MKFTKSIKPSEVKRDWIVVDATGKRFGRVISEIATILKGKHKPSYTPHIDCGDFVVVTNAQDVDFSKKAVKLESKKYHRHTGYFGGVRTETLGELLENNPAKLYRLATRGMLPKTNLGKEMLKKLKVYTGSDHPHTAQISN